MWSNLLTVDTRIIWFLTFGSVRRVPLDWPTERGKFPVSYNGGPSRRLFYLSFTVCENSQNLQPLLVTPWTECRAIPHMIQCLLFSLTWCTCDRASAPWLNWCCSVCSSWSFGTGKQGCPTTIHQRHPSGTQFNRNILAWVVAWKITRVLAWDSIH